MNSSLGAGSSKCCESQLMIRPPQALSRSTSESSLAKKAKTSTMQLVFDGVEETASQSTGDGSQLTFSKKVDENKPMKRKQDPTHESSNEPQEKIECVSESVPSASSSKSLTSHKLDEKCIVFIRDVPNMDGPRICKLLVDSLQEKDIYPVFVYSLIELLKYPQNVDRIRRLGLRERYASKKTPVDSSEMAQIMVSGCNNLMYDLFSSALRDPPNLIIFDYMSETFVDMDVIIRNAKMFGYKIFMLKQNDTGSKIAAVVKKISELITPLDIHHVTHLQEHDMWWHEPSGVYVPHLLPGHQRQIKDKSSAQQQNLEQQNAFEHFLRSTLDQLRELQKPKAGVFPASKFFGTEKPKETEEKLTLAAPVETPLTKTEEFLSIAAQKYIDKLKSILPELEKLENMDQVKLYFELRKNPEVQLVRLFEARCKQLTLTVVRDSKSIQNPNRRRLFDIFMEAALKLSDITIHAVPIGELVASNVFGELIEQFALNVGILDTITAYSTIILGLFKILIKKNERCIVLDSIDSQFIGLEEFLKCAKENQFKVYFCERNQLDQSAQAIIKEVIGHIQHRCQNPRPQ